MNRFLPSLVLLLTTVSVPAMAQPNGIRVGDDYVRVAGDAEFHIQVDDAEIDAVLSTVEAERLCEAGSVCADTLVVHQPPSPWLKWLVLSTGAVSMGVGWVMWGMHRREVDDLAVHRPQEAGYFAALDSFDRTQGASVIASATGGVLLSTAALAWLPERDGAPSALTLSVLGLGAAASIGASVGLLLTGPFAAADNSVGWGGREDRRWSAISLAASHAAIFTSAFVATLLRLDTASLGISAGPQGGTISATGQF